MTLNPSDAMFPHEASGGWTPTPRNDRAASSSIALAMLRVKKTMIVDHRFGQELAEHDAERPFALGHRGLDELLLAERQHLSADHPAYVGHIDDADDQDRDPQRVARDRHEAEAETRPTRRSRC